MVSMYPSTGSSLGRPLPSTNRVQTLHVWPRVVAWGDRNQQRHLWRLSQITPAQCHCKSPLVTQKPPCYSEAQWAWWRPPQNCGHSGQSQGGEMYPQTQRTSIQDELSNENSKAHLIGDEQQIHQSQGNENVMVTWNGFKISIITILRDKDRNDTHWTRPR